MKERLQYEVEINDEGDSVFDTWSAISEYITLYNESLHVDGWITVSDDNIGRFSVLGSSSCEFDFWKMILVLKFSLKAWHR